MNEILGERYELIEQIGVGGMAAVWKAQDRRLGRAVAIKVLHDRLAADQGFQRRFEREARSVASLNHPNIVVVHDFGHDDQTLYLVMELVAGESLAARLGRIGKLEIEEAIAIFQSVLAGLGEAHRHGIVHRDIKPSNILLASSGAVKVADFGIATALGSDTRLTDTGLFLGTTSYLSPEQCRGEPATPRSDLYAFGCVMYESLSGRPPFTGETASSVMYQHEYATPRPLTAERPGLPLALAAAATKALEKDPDLRFANAADVSRALDHYKTTPADGMNSPAEHSNDAAVTASLGPVDRGSGTEVLRAPLKMAGSESSR
ncbi:MAG TPA: protein kinase, partial [Acidimicrobiales bacterium]|nr:protein kinase [Acidimicrobiales bacterium]